MTGAGDPLLALARARGVATAYTNAWGVRRRASRRALAGVLAALGEPVDGPGGAAAALEARQRREARRADTRVVVAWDGRLPRGWDAGRGAVIELEEGRTVGAGGGGAPDLP